MSSEPEGPDVSPNETGPVTVVVTRRVRRGQERHYEQWLVGFQSAMRRFPGYLGVQTTLPQGEPREYVSIFRFANVAALRAWDQSSERAERLRALSREISDEVSIHETIGLETWFYPARQPVRWKMAVVVMVVVYILTVAISPVVSAVLPFAPPSVQLAASIGVEVLIMSYWVMPAVTSRLTPWLFARDPVTQSPEDDVNSPST